MTVTRNPTAPLTTDVALFDGPATTLSVGPTLREMSLPIRIEGVAPGTSGAEAATAANALYAQALYAVTHDASVAALVTDLREGTGDPEAASHGVEAELSVEAGTGHVAGFVLHLVADYEETGATSQAAAILAAVETALTTSTPLADVSLRERALAALAAVVAGVEPQTERNADRPDLAITAARFFDGDHTVDHGTMGLTMYRVAYAVELFGTSQSALDARVAAMADALRTAGTLGGLAFDTELDGSNPEALLERYTGPALGARLEGGIWVWTAAQEPTRLAA